MLFDLKSGKRRRVVQVVFGFLAFVFFISFVGFGIGSDVTGGIFDAIGLGGSSNSSDPQFDEQIEDAQDAIEANPENGNAYADLIAAYYSSASTGIQTDQSTGQVSISEDAHGDLEKAAQGWDDYLATKPDKVNVTAAASAVKVFYFLNDPSGAAEAQEVLAEDQKTASAYAQLAQFLYIDGKLEAGDAAADKAVAVAEPADRKQVQSNMDSLHEQAVKFQKQLERQREQGGQEQGEAQLQDPFGGLGGGSAPPVTPAP
jgi:hypothetical protein